MDPIAEQAQYELDLAVADLRDFMSRARRLRLQFDHVKNEELSSYRKVQACQEALNYCYANNPFGGMNDIIERRKAQLAEAERVWQETTLYVAQLRSEVAEISEKETERFTPAVAQRMREQDGEELACANEIIVNGTTQHTAVRSLEAIKVVAKAPDVRSAMVYGGDLLGGQVDRPLRTAERTLALSLSSPSRGASPMVAGRIGSPMYYCKDDSALPAGHNNNNNNSIAARPATSMASLSGTPSRALVLADETNYSAADSPKGSSLRTPAGNAIGSAVANTAYHSTNRPAHPSTLVTLPSAKMAAVATTKTYIAQDPATSGLRSAASAAGVTAGNHVRNNNISTESVKTAPRLPSAIRGTAQSPFKMTSVNFRPSDPQPVVVARPGHYGEQRALLACSEEQDLATPANNNNGRKGSTSTANVGRLNHVASHDSANPNHNPEAYRSMINGQLPPIALSPSQQRALQHSPFFRPGSPLVYAAADAAAVATQHQHNLDNSKCIPLTAYQICRDANPSQQPLSRPAYYASPMAEKVKHSITTPNTPLTDVELGQLFNTLDADGDGMLTMVEAAKHFDAVGTFGIPNHSKTFIQTSLKKTFSVDELISFDEFTYLVAKWGTL